MKSLEELKAIREKMQGQVGFRDEGEDGIRVVVGMATCGIAAGARPVLTTSSVPSPACMPTNLLSVLISGV